MEAEGEVAGDDKMCDQDETDLKGASTGVGWSLWLGFGQRDVSLKAVIGISGFWGKRAAEGGYLV